MLTGLADCLPDECYTEKIWTEPARKKYEKALRFSAELFSSRPVCVQGRFSRYFSSSRVGIYSRAEYTRL